MHTITLNLTLTTLLLISLSTFAQQPATLAETMDQAISQKEELAKNSLVKNVVFKTIGPTIMSGRVVDLAVNPKNPIEFYVGYASGGVWHTTNNGTTFTPIMDNAPTQNVGDIAVDWKSGTIWVGTGENNASRSSYAGIGILKSSDKGKTWQNLGLKDSHHIGRILINPKNPNEVVVGVTGHLYSNNNERGIYKTIDGGTTWTQQLFVDDASGIIDLQHAPDNFDVMFATSWTKDRKAWNFNGSGNNSAIYKSTDAGGTWTKVSTKTSGFPTGNGVGRIGIAMFDDLTIYAIHDSQFRRDEEKEKEDPEMLSKDSFKTMSAEEFLLLDDKRLNEFLKNNGFQEKYRAENVKQMVRGGSVKPVDLASYLEDANSMLFNTPVVGTEIYKSTDGGVSWKKTHNDYIDGVYFSYGYYFGHIYVSPNNEDDIYVYGVPILKSKDGGKSFKSIDADNVHADHHALWINPKNPNHLINGNDGGVNMTYDDGENWIKLNSPSVGQLYAINVDKAKPYNIYGGLQDNGVWMGSSNAVENKRWHQSGQYPWKMIMGGDGMQIQIDSRNNKIVYTGYQFGNYYRLNLETEDSKYIQPKHQLGENPYRFNWQTPILLSPHNQDIIYFAANKLMRSMNQGDDWTAISDDLTNGGKKGNVAYGTITTISESPFKFGLIYTGSDDGLIQLSKDSGATWKLVSTGLPKDLWISRVIASQHKLERVYAALNGYRWDDFNTYIYMSDDYGSTWKAIGNGIPNSPVNVILEDPENENVLYVGTDNGCYMSFDQGRSWQNFSNGLPNVAIHDLVIQPDTNDLLIGTHGRSIYKTNIANLQKMKVEDFNEDYVLFEIEDSRFSPRWGSRRSDWSDALEPSTEISYYSKSEGEKTFQILSENDAVLKEIKQDASKGFNYLSYDLSISEKGKKVLMKDNEKLKIKKAENNQFYLPKGKYKVKLGTKTTTFTIK